MHGHGDVEGKRPVVQHIDAVEQESDVRPSRHGHAALVAIVLAAAAAAGEERHGEGDGCDEGELEEGN